MTQGFSRTRTTYTSFSVRAIKEERKKKKERKKEEKKKQILGARRYNGLIKR
jgi:hypothetical protein